MKKAGYSENTEAIQNCDPDKTAYSEVYDMALGYFGQFRRTYTADFSPALQSRCFNAMAYVFEEYMDEIALGKMPECRQEVYIDFLDLLLLKKMEKKALENPVWQ